ncbi:GDSL-type esterase/lipase family protein [Muriicola sp.]|uniref:GDSL-type esterase/lipase family protein n=1 Tax=Muriicola sp. TaxID=2020856 RepID=UPI003C7525D7
MHLKKSTFFLFLFVSFFFESHAQIAEDFSEEVALIALRNDSVWNQNRETIVFTGSSSVRLWEGLEDLFPDYQVLNTGFGGSQTSDLLEHIQPLVLSYQPKKVFIYEGDNDLIFKKYPARIIRTTKKVINSIWQQYPNTQIVLISAKPSIVRWHLKKRYQRLNKKFKKLAEDTSQLYFVNVWDSMLQNGAIDESLFIEDGLHMNQKGYDLWYEAIKPFLN